jgi:hypothetical protein
LFAGDRSCDRGDLEVPGVDGLLVTAVTVYSVLVDVVNGDVSHVVQSLVWWWGELLVAELLP